MSLKGNKILVTGAASGIGKATSFYLASKGCDIVAVDYNSNGLNSLEREFEKNHYRVQCVAADLTAEDLESIFVESISDGKKLRGMVHCAGVSSIVPLRSLSGNRLHNVMKLNFYSFVELCRHYSKNKYSDGGSIVGISSLAAITPRAYELAYISSKAALNASIPCIAIELASKNIRVNGIMPGVVNTGMINGNQTEEQKTFIETLTKKTLLGAAMPEQISSVVSFLLSDESSMITGRVLPVDGGLFL